MTRITEDALTRKVVSVVDWLAEHSDTCPDWKTRLIETKLDGLLEVIDARDRRSIERRS